jgi:hypothetical protein
MELLKLPIRDILEFETIPISYQNGFSCSASAFGVDNYKYRSITVNTKDKTAVLQIITKNSITEYELRIYYYGKVFIFDHDKLMNGNTIWDYLN